MVEALLQGQTNEEVKSSELEHSQKNSCHLDILVVVHAFLVRGNQKRLEIGIHVAEETEEVEGMRNLAAF